MLQKSRKFVGLFRKKRNVFSRYVSPRSCHQLSYEKYDKQRFNPINIQLLSAGLHEQIFGTSENFAIDEKTSKAVFDHLRIHGLDNIETSKLKDVNFPLPKLLGSNISDHFCQMASALSKSYKTLLDKIANAQIPKMPSEWKFKTGWTRYNSDGSTESVPCPGEEVLLFDVEVCVKEGHFPTLATAVSLDHWYLWCSKRLVEDHFSWSQGISTSELIPFGLDTPGASSPVQLIIGHNVAFDRAFIKEQYMLQGNQCYFVDTMSLHICVSGLTGLQRAMSMASKKDVSQQGNGDFPNVLPTMWSDISSLNNLADVYSLYCDGAVLEKDDREVFVSGTMVDIKERFQELASYCARDVQATHEVLKKVVPMFFERFPHPVTFAGLLEMSSVYLPVNQNWERYLRDTQDTFDDLQKELKLSLMHLANDACPLLHDNKYKKDPWLWDLDWSTQELKFRKVAPPPKKPRKSKKKSNEAEIEELIFKDDEHEGNQSLEPKQELKPSDLYLQHIYESAASLRKVRPFLPGYPAWYRELCDKNKEGRSDWEPGPCLISSQMRCVPKLMRLTWDNYPLHYNAKHGWGYIVPNVTDQSDIDSHDFPLKELLELGCNLRNSEHEHTLNNCDINWLELAEPRESLDEESRLWQTIKGKNSKVNKELQHFGIGPYDIGIPGCSFYRMPHKDGPHKRVGNPLSKDFLSKVEDGTLKSWGKGRADRALLLSKMLSYWKNAHQRIMSQMVVWLSKDELPETLTKHETFDDRNTYGAILPRLIPAGTVTRRGVEPTWLTASNAYSDRVGSELKSMIQAPPGYHFVGADVDSQELWIAAVLGDSHFGKIHGCTAFGWMTLQGKKSAGTDMHSKTAKSVGVNRHQAKILNYARIYGAGKSFAQRLLLQFNHRLSPSEAKLQVKKIYAETKGTRRFTANEVELEDELTEECFLSPKKTWHGGSESHLFNKLEEIALSAMPRTPVLDCRISRALEPAVVDTNFMTSRINWVVQSSAVDYLHLMLVSMKWLFKQYHIDGRLSICIHDEVRYLVASEDRYRAALALQITNLWTRCLFAYKLDMNDLPQSVAFFSSVDIDKALRKEVDMDSKTPSNPHGLEKGYGIPVGELLDIHQILDKTNSSLTNQ